MPLVMHEGDDRARFAGKRYLLFSMSGAALGFIAVVFISACGSAPMAFALGGVLDPEKIAGHETLLRTVFTIAFFGFGVKAALLPMSAWLPAASVAPTPVTALLHAVAVVKAGAFACIRLTYYSFGTELLSGTFAQYIPQAAAAATVVTGSFLALRQNHLKRRLAWSTVSNLSYILIGVTAMTPAGLAAGTMHMVYHAFVKITLFFCVGAVMVKTGNDYLDQIEGLAKRMPVTFACFTVAGLALIGGQYAYLALERTSAGMRLIYVLSEGEARAETVAAEASVSAGSLTLRLTLTPVDTHSASVQFTYAGEDGTFADIGTPFSPARHTWVGARLGLFAMGRGEGGYALFGPFAVARTEADA